MVGVRLRHATGTLGDKGTSSRSVAATMQNIYPALKGQTGVNPVAIVGSYCVLPQEGPFNAVPSIHRLSHKPALHSYG